MREFDVFQGYYCGLCKTLQHKYGLITRLSLNYDLTFLALLLDSLNTEEATFSREGCIINPLKKKPVRKMTSSLAYCAALSVMMGMLKLQDDWQDEHSKKAFLGKFFLKTNYQQAVLDLEEKVGSIFDKMKQMQALEQARAQDIDGVASVFAHMMADLFVPSSVADEKTKRVLAWLGFNLGRWVYLMDAYDDIEQDLESGSYNVLLLYYRYKEQEKPSAFRHRIKEKMYQHLTYTLSEAAKSFELLDIKSNCGLLENIIYMGTRQRMAQIFNRGDEGNEKSI